MGMKEEGVVSALGPGQAQEDHRGVLCGSHSGAEWG